MVREQTREFTWDYLDMRGIHPDTYIHHIYTNEETRLVQQPQRLMNLALKDIVKEELQKLLVADFIHPISDSKWLPLVVVPKKNRKWKIYIDYRELDKAMLRDYFPLLFINQVLDTLAAYGDDFPQALENLEKGLIHCQEADLALSSDKCRMMQTKRIVLGHYVSFEGIQVDPTKIEVILRIPILSSQKEGIMPMPMPDEFPDEALFSISTIIPWFTDVANYLVSGKLPQNMSAWERYNIVQSSANYSWIEGDLFYTGPYLIMRQCVREDKMHDILSTSHNEPCGNHFSEKRTTYKVLCIGYYWPMLFKYAKKFVSSCDACQIMGRLVAFDEMPLHPQIAIEPFEKWAFDFVGPISQISNNKKYILLCTNYVTKWVEAKALYATTKTVVVEFLFEDIFTRFGVPREFVTDQGTQFTSKLVKALTDKYQVKHHKLTPYHPQANGQVESTNKVLESILTKTIQLHHIDWAEKLLEAL
eukprot:PITA_26557